jgi:hypothetical protein
VKQLVLSHNMARSLGPLKENLALIREHYDGPIKVAEDLMCIEWLRQPERRYLFCAATPKAQQGRQRAVIIVNPKHYLRGDRAEVNGSNSFGAAVSPLPWREPTLADSKKLGARGITVRI